MNNELVLREERRRFEAQWRKNQAEKPIINSRLVGPPVSLDDEQIKRRRELFKKSKQSEHTFIVTINETPSFDIDSVSKRRKLS